MMDLQLTSLVFPDRARFKSVELVAVYVEPRVDSGERICVGVVATQEGVVQVAEVPNLKRLRCLYGSAALGLVYAGQIALKSFADCVQRSDFETAVRGWAPPAQGLFLGEPVVTASSSLADALRVSLSQFSSLYQEPDEQDDGEPTAADSRIAVIRGWRLERMVKEATILLRPDFEKRFGQKRRIRKARGQCDWDM
jgi:hypothetical protein